MMSLRSLLLRSALTCLILVLPGLAAAAPITANQDHILHNHPDGNQAPPGYGLRLDGLMGDTSEEWTFDFDAAGAQMRLTWDDTANTIWIRGTALGGEDIGATHINTSFYEIDFTYTNVVDTGGSLRVNPTATPDVGTISRLDGGGTVVETWTLDAYEGSHDFAFKLENGHRDFPGVSGWGWVNHSTFPEHEEASDWLFTVQPVPEPHSVALFICSGLIAGWAVRRQVQV